MKEQPNFGRVFQSHFGTVARKVHYCVRESQLHYDILFMASLLHDAKFQIKNISVKDRRVTFPVERECWELPLIKVPAKRKQVDLARCRSRLTISPVTSIDWQFKHGFDMSPSEDHWIGDIMWMWNGYYNNGMIDLVLLGNYWKCTLHTTDANLQMELKDLEVPYYRSQSERTPNPYKALSSQG